MKLIPTLFAAAAVLSSSACGSGGSSQPASAPASPPPVRSSKAPGAGKPPVTLATKNFTEEFILGQLYAQALQAKGYRVRLKPDVGASEIVDRALVTGQVDGYPEYTGTILSALAHQSARPASAADAYARARSFEATRGVAELAMAPATDTDVIAAKPAYASQHSLKSLSDLGRLGSSATLGAPPEFRGRFNGLVGLQDIYGVHAIKFTPLAIGTQYRALDAGRVQLAAVFTTDGQLSEGGYQLLSDPQNIFGFQNVTFVVRKRVLAAEGQDFAQTIDAVSAKLSTQALRVMNAAVVLDQQQPAAVAKQFLQANGLI